MGAQAARASVDYVADAFCLWRAEADGAARDVPLHTLRCVSPTWRRQVNHSLVTHAWFTGVGQDVHSAHTQVPHGMPRLHTLSVCFCFQWPCEHHPQKAAASGQPADAGPPHSLAQAGDLWLRKQDACMLLLKRLPSLLSAYARVRRVELGHVTQLPMLSEYYTNSGASEPSEGLDDLDLTPLTGLTALEELAVGQGWIFGEVPRLPSLKALHVDGCLYGPASWVANALVPGLTRVVLFGELSDLHGSCLAAVTQLQHLELYHVRPAAEVCDSTSPLWLADFSWLHSLTLLTSLRLQARQYHMHHEEFAHALRPLRNLERLHIESDCAEAGEYGTEDEDDDWDGYGDEESEEDEESEGHEVVGDTSNLGRAALVSLQACTYVAPKLHTLRIDPTQPGGWQKVSSLDVTVRKLVISQPLNSLAGLRCWGKLQCDAPVLPNLHALRMPVHGADATLNAATALKSLTLALGDSAGYSRLRTPPLPRSLSCLKLSAEDVAPHSAVPAYWQRWDQNLLAATCPLLPELRVCSTWIFLNSNRDQDVVWPQVQALTLDGCVVAPGAYTLTLNKQPRLERLYVFGGFMNGLSARPALQCLQHLELHDISKLDGVDLLRHACSLQSVLVTKCKDLRRLHIPGQECRRIVVRGCSPALKQVLVVRAAPVLRTLEVADCSNVSLVCVGGLAPVLHSLKVEGCSNECEVQVNGRAWHPR